MRRQNGVSTSPAAARTNWSVIGTSDRIHASPRQTPFAQVRALLTVPSTPRVVKRGPVEWSSRSSDEQSPSSPSGAAHSPGGSHGVARLIKAKPSVTCGDAAGPAECKRMLGVVTGFA
jgi:hypothetical protein